ncbi:unnamed protein product [Rotaria sp. Silwood2]|nr:unnamed protein product [Rotaria sp. Silwood2]
MKRLKIHPKSSHHLILQPAEQCSGSPRMAYLIRQPLENKLRQQIDKWHNTSFSLEMPQKIQCQWEINQDFFEWNDSVEMVRSLDNSRCSSPVLSIQSVCSHRTKPIPWHSSAFSTISCQQSVSKKSYFVEQSDVRRIAPINQENTPKKKHTINSLRSESKFHHRQPPSDMSSWPTRWQWTNQMIPKEESDCDVLYWLESESVKERNIVIKIYLPQTNQTARIRAQREQVALERLKQLICVPKLLRSNVHSANDNQSNKEFWNIMRFIDAERLSDYVKNNKADLREALKIAEQLLTIIKQIHAQNIIHRDIQPKNILVQYRSNSDEISLILMNFSSAWINNYQWTNSEENIDVELGNSFYQMPQFEKRQNENNDEQLREYQRSPKIDTTGIPEHIMKHLTLVFDRGFGDPNQQWSVDELDYQLQFMLTLITNENEQVNYFPAPQIINNIILSPSIPLEDPFVYVISLIHHLKHQFATRYSKCVCWSTEKKNSWNAQNGRIENYDLLIFSCQEKNFQIDIKWDVQLLQEQNFLFYVKARTDNKIIIELPLGVWKINEQTVNFEVHLQNFEIEIKTLINILFKSIVH